MRKRLSIVVLLIVLAMSGCGRIPGADLLEQLARSYGGAGKDADKGESEAEDDRQNESLSGQDSAKGGSLTKDEDSETEEEKGQEEADSYVKGAITDDGWVSEYWNLRYTAPEDIFMLSEEGLDAVMGISKDKISENYTEQQQKYLEMTTLYEMMSSSSAGDVNVVVTVEKLMMKGMTAESYTKAAVFQLRLMKDPVMEILDDSNTTEIAGETYNVINAATEQNGVQWHQDYYIRVVGDRAIGILISYTDATGDKAAEILDSFSAY